MGFCCKILSPNDLTPNPISRPGTHCLQRQRANARANLWWRHEPFRGETSIALRPCAGKAGVVKRWGGMSYLVYVTLICHKWKHNDFHYSGAYLFISFCALHKCVLVGYSRHKNKTTFIGGMELASLRCNRDFTSASSYGLGWYKYSDTSSIPPMHGGFLLLCMRHSQNDIFPRLLTLMFSSWIMLQPINRNGHVVMVP